MDKLFMSSMTIHRLYNRLGETMKSTIMAMRLHIPLPTEIGIDILQLWV